jgi:hypothetical protein
VSLLPPDYEYAACRTFGHAWNARTERADGGGWLLILRCSRCTMERTDHVTPTGGRLIDRRYKQPEGYAVKRPKDNDEPVASREDWREKYIRQITGTRRR